MAHDILHIQSISQLHRALGYDKPQHPLVSVIDVSKPHIPKAWANQRISADFYVISMKEGFCGLQYGRNYYDFEEGVLSFTAPNQVVSLSEDSGENSGWILIFHADLIRHSNLGKNIGHYSFFSYDVHEALHLSEQEKNILNDCTSRIVYEYNQNIDSHSQSLFVSNIELILNYCMRFYERQFHTRKKHNTDVVSRVDSLLRTYYLEGQQVHLGSPTVQYVADKINLSANYLSDLLKRETGKNAKEHINLLVVERAKTMLLNSEQNVSEIAFDLGFNYPHYFSRMFKQQTGMTPKEYRKLELN